MKYNKINPKQINLHSFYNKSSLNPKIWDKNGKIRNKVRIKLLDIAKQFIESTEINFIPVDIVIVGSIAGFNWSKYSDIDLHIIADFKAINDDFDLVKNYFYAKKVIWNDKHTDLTIYDYDVELYVQDKTEENASNGIYSLKNNNWIKIPEKLDQNLKKDIIQQTASLYINKVEYYNNKFNELTKNKSFILLQQKVEYLYDTIIQGRKTSLAAEGEQAPGNIIFKVLRRSGHLAMLNELKTKLYDKINSIDETYQVDSNKLISEGLNHKKYDKDYTLIRELLYNEIVKKHNSNIFKYCLENYVLSDKLSQILENYIELIDYDDIIDEKGLRFTIDQLIQELYDITAIRIRYGLKIYPNMSDEEEYFNDTNSVILSDIDNYLLIGF